MSARSRHAVAGAALLAACALASCTDNRSRARPVQADRIARDVPSVLMRTIGAEATLRGADPLLVSGYGIVVGLDGTGAADVHPGVRAMLEREMVRRGVGQESKGMGWITPARMIDDTNTAAVLIQAVIPAGASEGARFDVLVRALPGSSTTSLEGGRLWTTELHAGLVIPGGPDTATVAEAAGDIFVNPFADPAQSGDDAINRTTGRILNGGVVRDARKLVLALDLPSHARTRSITATINTKFPQGPADREPTARGQNEETIEIHVPMAWADRTEEFIRVLMATRVDLTYPEESARRYVNALRDQPELADELSMRLQAIGEPAIPFLRDLYDYAEPTPRLAALRAGARLGDALATPHLRDIATAGPPGLRVSAIELLADMGPDPQVNLTLRALLDADQIEVRIAAYEALVRRRDPTLNRRRMEDKFVLDTIPAAKPMIYVSQQAEPRIAVFGAGLAIKRPTLVSGWSDRLMLVADSATDDVRVYYRDYKTGKSSTQRIRPEVVDLIQYMAHKQTPEEPAPGLDLTYSEVVGALHEVWKGGGIDADVVAEQDKLAAELLRSADVLLAQDRPETSEPQKHPEGAPLPGASAEPRPVPPASPDPRPDSPK